MYDIHTGTRNFCKFCTPVAQYSGYGYALVKIVCRYGYGYNIRVTTRNLCEFCDTSTPVPGTCASSVKTSISVLVPRNTQIFQNTTFIFHILFERSEFLIDTPHKKICASARVHVSNNLGFSVYVRKYHIRTSISSLSAGYQDTYMYLRMCQGGVRIMCHICS